MYNKTLLCTFYCTFPVIVFIGNLIWLPSLVSDVIYHMILYKMTFVSVFCPDDGGCICPGRVDLDHHNQQGGSKYHSPTKYCRISFGNTILSLSCEYVREVTPVQFDIVDIIICLSHGSHGTWLELQAHISQVREEVDDIFLSKIELYGGENSSDNATAPFDLIQQNVRTVIILVICNIIITNNNIPDSLTSVQLS